MQDVCVGGVQVRLQLYYLHGFKGLQGGGVTMIRTMEPLHRRHHSTD